jgi:hypothetical protein
LKCKKPDNRPRKVMLLQPNFKERSRISTNKKHYVDYVVISEIDIEDVLVVYIGF